MSNLSKYDALYPAGQNISCESTWATVGQYEYLKPHLSPLESVLITCVLLCLPRRSSSSAYHRNGDTPYIAPECSSPSLCSVQ
jgi:hypothetical protein